MYLRHTTRRKDGKVHKSSGSAVPGQLPSKAIACELSRIFWTCSNVVICSLSMMIVMAPGYHANPPLS